MLTNASLLRLLLVLLLVVPCACGGCKACIVDVGPEIVDAETRALNALDDAIAALERQSSAWQGVLEETLAQLTEDAQSTLRNEVSSVLARATAAVGGELRCDFDFVGRRVRQGLEAIRAKLLGEPRPPIEPAFCQVVPVAVDRALVPARLPRIEFYGYDFDLSDDLSVLLERTDGSTLDVTSHLDRPTHYAMTLKFGATGVQLDDHSQRFVLSWSGRVISTIAIVQPQRPVCASKVVRHHPGKVTFMPPKSGKGDGDFHGNGPNVSSSVTLLVEAQRIVARVAMTAKETKKDWTTASGTRDFLLYSAEPGWRIDGVAGPLSSSHSFRDSNHVIDTFHLGAGGPVSRLDYVGDTKGDEAGSRTKVDVSFNELVIEVSEIGDCVPAAQLIEARRVGLLSDAAFRAAESKLGRDALMRALGGER